MWSAAGCSEARSSRPPGDCYADLTPFASGQADFVLGWKCSLAFAVSKGGSLAKGVLGVALAICLLLVGQTLALAFVEDTPPTFENGGADPTQTGDPASVAAAQQALAHFFEYTNSNYSILGYSNPQIMRQERGNVGTDWLDQSLSLARGQLVGGWKNMNWVPGFGWCHCSTVRPSLSAGATGRWEYSFADRALVAHLPAAETAMAGA